MLVWKIPRLFVARVGPECLRQTTKELESSLHHATSEPSRYLLYNRLAGGLSWMQARPNNDAESNRGLSCTFFFDNHQRRTTS